MELAFFKRIFCNGNKIKKGLNHKSSDPMEICVTKQLCWSVQHLLICYFWGKTASDVNIHRTRLFFHPCIIICALSVFKVHKCQFFPHSIKKRPGEKSKENKVTFVKCWRWKAVEFPVFEMRPTSKFLICWLCLELVSINWVAESKLWPCLLLPDISLVILCVERFGGPVESMTQLQMGEAGC